MNWQQLTKYGLVAIAGLFVLSMAMAIEVCCDRAFVCENTGSRKGHRDWAFGLATAHWYKASPLEEFIKSKAPNALVHDWISYAGTGKNIFGSSISSGHAFPNDVLQFDFEVQSWWMGRSSPEQVGELYDLFKSADDEAIAKRIGQISEAFLHDESPQGMWLLESFYCGKRIWIRSRNCQTSAIC